MRTRGADSNTKHFIGNYIHFFMGGKQARNFAQVSTYTMKPRIPAWNCTKENEFQVATYLAALQNKIEQTYTEPRLVPNGPKKAQPNEDEQIEIISLNEEDEVEKKIVLPGPCPSWEDLFTNKENPSRLSDVSLSITSLIQQLTLDKVVEPVFQMGKKQPSFLTSFGIELQAKMPPPDRNCRRTRDFLSVTKHFAGACLMCPEGTRNRGFGKGMSGLWIQMEVKPGQSETQE
ncbi:uncharacterized protein LOC123249833 [Gracilinanus agilis]|uniref:uncharacterized protein LOC123249833 n=1 Tax=Gracilinanus agilis TaxID=191870 RepID=UPI001CFD2965|nr:uncharacterized protein LOC123249833 [Gracilinanus agilis]